MRAVVQRVSQASVTVDGDVVGQINRGLMVLLGVATDDTQADANLIADKIAGLRIFPDDDGKMNRSVIDIHGGILLVSQFTLLGDCRTGRRPSFITAARPETACNLYEAVAAELRSRNLNVATGRFQEHMDVALVNDGPVTLLLDTRKQF
jgi:D-tyrosyl-tRNA(Tyr) deacylase